MSKEVQMTFRVEPSLRADFSKAAALADRPAAQVLREFMRAYVSESLQRSHVVIDDPVSKAERRHREAAVNFARSSVGLEGFKQHKADDDLTRRYIAGEITVADAINAINESAHER